MYWKKYTYQDLIENGISEEVVKIIKNIINNPINIKSYNVGELDEMESGRTDVFFIQDCPQLVNLQC